MRAIVTGQVGVDKKKYLESTVALAGECGEIIEAHHIGDMMYAEGLDVSPGRILDLPLSRLSTLRRAAFKDLITAASPPCIYLLTHQSPLDCSV